MGLPMSPRPMNPTVCDMALKLIRLPGPRRSGRALDAQSEPAPQHVALLHQREASVEG